MELRAIIIYLFNIFFSLLIGPFTYLCTYSDLMQLHLYVCECVYVSTSVCIIMFYIICVDVRGCVYMLGYLCGGNRLALLVMTCQFHAVSRLPAKVWFGYIM